MTDVVFIYITHPDYDGASTLARELVDHHLAAGVNLLPGMRTVYRWQGKVETGAETVLIAKTRADLLSGILAYVLERHPYQCPCVAMLPVSGGNPAYLEWIGQSTIASSAGELGPPSADVETDGGASGQ
jgi:periplasmic divalent cation tolerance protein